MLAPGQQMSLAPSELAGLDPTNLQGLLSLSGTPLGSGSPVAGAGRLPLRLSGADPVAGLALLADHGG